jgi:hypothetical protein
VSVAILINVDNIMDIDKIDDRENMDDKEDDDAAMDDDSEDLYLPTSQPSPLLTLTPDDMEFLTSLEEPCFFVSNASFDVSVKRPAPRFKKVKRHRWLQEALANEAELLVNELEAAEINLARWEDFFWIERISTRDDEDRVSGQ